MKKLHQLIFSLVCLVFFFGYRAYPDLQKSYKLNFSTGQLALAPTAIDEGDSSFATLFRPDDHVISVPSIPIDCSRILLVPTELSAVSQKSVET
jgi:hypothetical protein